MEFTSTLHMSIFLKFRLFRGLGGVSSEGACRIERFGKHHLDRTMIFGMNRSGFSCSALMFLGKRALCGRGQPAGFEGFGQDVKNGHDVGTIGVAMVIKALPRALWGIWGRTCPPTPGIDRGAACSFHDGPLRFRRAKELFAEGKPS